MRVVIRQLLEAFSVSDPALLECRWWVKSSGLVGSGRFLHVRCTPLLTCLETLPMVFYLELPLSSTDACILVESVQARQRYMVGRQRG